MGTERKKPWKLQVGEETIQRLETVSEDLGRALSANEIAAAAVFEISRVPARNLWTVLGVIRQYASPETVEDEKGPKKLHVGRQALISR